jgi:hypothetical protein
MLHACVVRFDVTKNLENFLNFGVTKQGPRGKSKASVLGPSLLHYMGLVSRPMSSPFQPDEWRVGLGASPNVKPIPAW